MAWNIDKNTEILSITDTTGNVIGEFSTVRHLFLGVDAGKLSLVNNPTLGLVSDLTSKESGVYALVIKDSSNNPDLKFLSHAGLGRKQTNSIRFILLHARTSIEKSICNYIINKKLNNPLELFVYILDEKYLATKDLDIAGKLYDAAGVPKDWQKNRPNRIQSKKMNNSESSSDSAETQVLDDTIKDNKINSAVNLSHNLIVFGAPGTGKSYKIDEEAKKAERAGNVVKRVTFYPDYSYYQFVGSYKPYMDGDKIKYRFVEGPFISILSAALNSKDNNKCFILIIEEINRANAAAVFGDFFQALDRKDDNSSKYPITPSVELADRLKELGVPSDSIHNLRIPSNMYIWATMNSADQGVFTLDTAFKRRWDFEYLGINEGEKEIEKYHIQPSADEDYKWNDIRKMINEALIKLKINEDKQLGPFFLDCTRITVVQDSDNTIVLDYDEFSNVFKNKVLMYLFEDAARSKRDKLFNDLHSFHDICKKFDDDGIGEIFNTDLISLQT